MLNPRSPLFEQCCAFTGRLQKYTRKEAMQVLEKIGGFSERGVTKKTRFLILGTQIKDGEGLSVWKLLQACCCEVLSLKKATGDYN